MVAVFACRYFLPYDDCNPNEVDKIKTIIIAKVCIVHEKQKNTELNLEQFVIFLMVISCNVKNFLK